MAYNHLNTPTKCDIKPCQMCHFIKLNWFIKTRWWRCRSLSVVTINYSKSSEHRIHTGIGAGNTTHHLSQQHTNKPPASTTTCGVVHSAGNLGCNNAFIHQCNADVKGVDILAIHNKNHPPIFQKHILFMLWNKYGIQNTQQCLLYFQKS